MNGKTRNRKMNVSAGLCIRLFIALMLCMWVIPLYTAAAQEEPARDPDYEVFSETDRTDEIVETGELVEGSVEGDAGVNDETGEIDEIADLIVEEEESGFGFNPYVFSVDGNGETASVELQPELMDLEPEEDEFLEDLIIEETMDSQVLGNSTGPIYYQDTLEINNLTYNVATDVITIVVNMPLPAQTYRDLKGVTFFGAIDGIVGGSNMSFDGFLPNDRLHYEELPDTARFTVNETMVVEPDSPSSETPDIAFMPHSPKAGDRIIINKMDAIFENGTISLKASESAPIPQAPLDENSFNVTLSPASFKFNGSPCTPEVIVETSSGKKLTKDEDFTVVFKDNDKAGTASMIVTGKGDYTGSVTKYFQIDPADDPGNNPGNNPGNDPPIVREPAVINAQDVTLIVSKKKRVINLGATTDGGALTYSSSNANVAVDTAGNVTIKKNFMGEAVITITASETPTRTAAQKNVVVKVTPPKTKVTKVITTPTQSTKMTVTIKWKKSGRKDISGYMIRYSEAKDFTSAVVKKYRVKGRMQNSKKLTLKKGKTYYVQVCTYKSVSGKRICSAWSKTKKVKIPK